MERFQVLPMQVGNGWVNAEIFDSWFYKQFLTHAPSACPLLLLLDGHLSDFELRVLHLAGVIIFCSPPNTTHHTQPLDKGCFSLLEKRMSVVFKQKSWLGCYYILINVNVEIFAKAKAKGMKIKNIIGDSKNF